MPSLSIVSKQLQAGSHKFALCFEQHDSSLDCGIAQQHVPIRVVQQPQLGEVSPNAQEQRENASKGIAIAKQMQKTVVKRNAAIAEWYFRNEVSQFRENTQSKRMIILMHWISIRFDLINPLLQYCRTVLPESNTFICSLRYISLPEP